MTKHQTPIKHTTLFEEIKTTLVTSAGLCGYVGFIALAILVAIATGLLV